MKIKAILTMLIMLGGACLYALPDTADAARLGGGRSFGSRPSMSQPAQAPSSSFQRQQTAQQRQAVQAQQPQRKGLFGGMGGLLGGLLAGSLIGSLLFGGGFSGGGIMDILLLGILLFVGLKLFARFRAKSAPAPAPAGSAPMGGMEPPLQRNDTAATGWDSLRDQETYAAQPEVVIPMPEDFDADEFLRGAKMAYNRLQLAWDNRDLNDIAQFASPAVMEAVRQQLAEETEPSKTEILLVNAQLLNVTNEGSEQRAQVYFDVLMRERPEQATPSNVREIWHFIRSLDGGTWKLDGIQQVA